MPIKEVMLFIAGLGIGSVGTNYFGGITHFVNTTETSSTSTGSIQITGGVGIGSKLYVGDITTIINNTDASNT